MIIVTGGAGFIGSVLIHKLNQIGYDQILIVDDFDTIGKKYRNIINLNFIQLIDYRDFFNYMRLNLYHKNIEGLFHFGARTDTLETDTSLIFKQNYDFTIEIIKYCMTNNIFLIQASSAAVYGNTFNKFDPLNEYAASKCLIDKYIINNNLKETILSLRFFNVYGPHEYHKGDMSSFIYRTYQKIENDYQKPFIYDVKSRRDFIHVEDCVNIAIYLWQNKLTGFYDVGTGMSVSWYDILQLVLKFTNNTEEYYLLYEFPNKLKGRYQYFTKADITYLKNTSFKWNYLSMQSGIKSYINKLQQLELFY